MPSGRMTDSELVARVQGGDLGAFDRLIARHRARLLTIARTITGDGEAAQDVVQEALLRAYRALSALRNGDRFGPWLNTIVRRQGQRWLREGGRQPEPFDLTSLHGAPGGTWDTPPSPGEPMDTIRRGLAELTRRERRVMVLHYLEGYTCEEIAAQLRLAAGSVKRILHNSRRKARTECVAVAQAERNPTGPRRLYAWIDGSPGSGAGNVFYHLRPLLAQTICLAVNKTPKTVHQIADGVGAHPDYVAEVAADLLDMDVLSSPKKSHYLTNFIAFDREDWRRLTRLLREPAGDSAQRLSSAEERLRTAFESTPLAASGFAWQDVIWPVFAVLLTNTAASRSQPESWRLPRPDRPGGGRYYLGGREEVPDFAPLWTTGFDYNLSHPLPYGCFWTWGLERQRSQALRPGRDTAEVARAFLHGPLAEREALARVGDDADRWRAALAQLLKEGLLERAGGKYRLAVPVFTEADSSILTPELDALIAPVVREVVEPALKGLDDVLSGMGYGHRRDQYHQWYRWLAGNIMGEALRFLMEQGVLPRPDEPAPPTFAFIAWTPDLPLMSWGLDY